MPTKPKLEYRLVCGSFDDKNKRGHGTHTHLLPARLTPKERGQRLIDINHQYEMRADRATMPQAIQFNNAELPWRIQGREVAKWVDDA